jgi:hypothetical protein
VGVEQARVDRRVPKGVEQVVGLPLELGAHHPDRELCAALPAPGDVFDVYKAAAAVARGTKNSRALRAIGAAKAAFKTRF